MKQGIMLSVITAAFIGCGSVTADEPDASPNPDSGATSDARAMLPDAAPMQADALPPDATPPDAPAGLQYDVAFINQTEIRSSVARITVFARLLNTGSEPIKLISQDDLYIDFVETTVPSPGQVVVRAAMVPGEILRTGEVAKMGALEIDSAVPWLDEMMPDPGTIDWTPIAEISLTQIPQGSSFLVRAHVVINGALSIWEVNVAWNSQAFTEGPPGYPNPLGYKAIRGTRISSQ